MTSPGRLEVARRSPTIVLDGAHNPHGAEATAAALQEAFSFSPLVGVVGVMADKDVEGLLVAFEPVFAEIVLHPELPRPRAVSADDLAPTSPRASSAPTGCTWPRGSTTPWTSLPVWPRAAAAGTASRSAPAACW